ncbi:MAG: hypothetical protein AB7L09_25730 [Nitrospira sp.]
MKLMPRYAMQTGGSFRRWSDPQLNSHLPLLKLSFDCEVDPRPGILILTKQNNTSASAMTVKNLRKELPKLLEHCDENTIAYFKSMTDETERNRMLGKLTAAPIFNDDIL